MICRTIGLILLEFFHLLFDFVKWVSGDSGFVLRYHIIKNIFADCGENIFRDSNVLFGPNVVRMASNHILTTRNIPLLRQGWESGKIIIENDRWIGANVVALPNVTIGNGAGGIGCLFSCEKKIDFLSVAGRIPANVISNQSG